MPLRMANFTDDHANVNFQKVGQIPNSQGQIPLPLNREVMLI
jgi:hypothetical protein